MSAEPQNSPLTRWQRIGPWFDRNTPRTLKLIGLVGMTVSIVMAPFGLFIPVMFGGSLMAASGGYVTDAFQVLRQGKE